MAVKVMLTPMGFHENRAWYDRKTGITLTQGVTSNDLTDYSDLLNVYRSVINGTLMVVDGTTADLATLVGVDLF